MLPSHFPKWQNVYNHFRRMEARGVWQKICWSLNEMTRKKRPQPNPQLPADRFPIGQNSLRRRRAWLSWWKEDQRPEPSDIDRYRRHHLGCSRPCREPRRHQRRLCGGPPEPGKVARSESDMRGSRYRGTFASYVREIWSREVHFTSREGKGFAIEPKRWVVERTFGWFNGQRRLGKDHEKLTENSEAMIYIAAIARSLRNPIFN